MGRIVFSAILAMISASGCHQAALPTIDDQDAVERYFDADTTLLLEVAAEGSLAEAMIRFMANGEDAAEQLETALLTSTDRSLVERLGPLVLQEHIVDYDYAAALSSAGSLGLDDVLTPVQAVYAAFPKPYAEAEANIIEIPYSDGRIRGFVNGEAVDIIFDTGAPNVGIDGDLVERLDLTTDTSVSRISRVPAYGLEFPVYATLIDELRLGTLTVHNVPANFGSIPEDQKEAAALLKSQTNNAPVIMGLDPIRPFVDAIEFDWDEGLIRLTVKSDTPPAKTNYILNDGRAPVIKVSMPGRVTNLSFDSGAYGHIVGPETVEKAVNLGRRDYQLETYSFSETLIGVDIAGVGETALWASNRRFAESPDFGVSGVLGVLNTGKLKLDFRSRTLSLSGYDPRKAFYAFKPTDERFTDEGRTYFSMD